MAQTVALDGVVYTVTPHARRGRRVVLRCEPPVGAPIPTYASRVRLRARLGPESVVVFSDAARGAEVWSQGGRERIRWPGEPELSLRPEKRPVGGCAAVPAKLLEMAGLEAAGEPFSALRVALADPAGPAAVRRVWRSARALRVLDPACGGGEWLAGALETLEGVYADCLEQMAVWLGEIALGRGKRRPEYLRDFRVALARRGAIRESVLLSNLHGVAPDEKAAAACRARLRRGTTLPAALVRVRAGDPARGFATRADLARALVGLPDAARALRDLREEAEAAARAEALLRATWLAGKVEGSALAGSLRAIEARRSPLRRRLDALAFRAAGGDPGDPRALRRWLAAHRPLHPFLEWPGRFHLVRGEGP